MTCPNWNAAEAAAAAVVAEWAPPGAAAPGGTVLLFDRDGIRGEASAGLASLVHGIPFTAATPTRFASLTKHVFCAFALRSGLNLDAPLGSLLPGLPEPIAGVPVFRALSMTGGIPDLMQSYVLCGVPSTAALDGPALDAFTNALPGLDTAPGSEVSYSNTGYRLAEQALARRGTGFGAWVEGALNAGLGTGFRFPAAWDQPVPGLADGYWRSGPDAAWRIGAYGMALSASGALCGGARDLATWLGALLHGDGPAGDVLGRLATPVTLGDGRPVGYGLGLALSSLGGHPLIGHGGHLPGFKNHFLLDAARGIGVLLLSNREETEPYAGALRVMAALLGATLPEPAQHMLPDGLFVEEGGPAWIEHRGGALTFLGAREALHVGEAPEEAVSLSPYLPIRLRRDGEGIAGEIGHASRRFRPVRPDAALSRDFAGIWRADAQHAELMLEVAGDGSGQASYGVGPLHRRVALTPLDATRALMPVGGPPWPGRACLWLHAPDTLRLVTNRSRVLDFHRA
ncbi:beta-lactamase family protein [Roseomonas hellenica]|uniref:Beta-lactamase family protein n=1 Tax=Plastoroseomonas hellenica TaxID=2687306 RepID=A0ABS5F4L2_9PROT|nr:serine hydrolase domain-containing protein [Plastoroseomonas hellenica]MBR0667477.1 beta-lactamase family protein [Plastoroseomonas hellenica]